MYLPSHKYEQPERWKKNIATLLQYVKAQKTDKLHLYISQANVCKTTAKLVTTVQDCVSTFVMVVPLHIFQETIRQFPAVFGAANTPPPPKKKQIFLTLLWIITSHVLGDKTRHQDISSCVSFNQSMYFKPKHDFFLDPSQCFLCLNLTIPQAQHLHNLKKLNVSTYLWFARTYTVHHLFCWLNWWHQQEYIWYRLACKVVWQWPNTSLLWRISRLLNI